jgi:hypothetical protein
LLGGFAAAVAAAVAAIAVIPVPVLGKGGNASQQ